MLFEKSSLRTRTTFEIAVRELGGHVIGLQPDVALGRREPVADIARNLERWVDAVVIRTFSQRRSRSSPRRAPRLHVINALTDDEHPCQTVADFLTLREHWGTLRGRTMAYVGDGNNVATSLAHAAAMLGVNLHVASPEGYSCRMPWCSRRPTPRARGPPASLHRPGRRGGWRRRRLHRHLDVDGPGGRNRACGAGLRAGIR